MIKPAQLRVARNQMETDMTQSKAPKFLPLGTVLCPECGYQNLNWRFVCSACLWPLDDDEDDVVAERAKAETA